MKCARCGEENGVSEKIGARCIRCDYPNVVLPDGDEDDDAFQAYEDELSEGLPPKVILDVHSPGTFNSRWLVGAFLNGYTLTVVDNRGHRLTFWEKRQEIERVVATVVYLYPNPLIQTSEPDKEEVIAILFYMDVDDGHVTALFYGPDSSVEDMPLY
jgi:hypothetical protein